ncbi:Serpin domain [Trinorchestia longiramus]|nr:Serpin domain [Trinorchestia longiramus]
MTHEFDGRVVSDLHKSTAANYGPTDSRPVRPRRPMRQNSQDQPLDNSFGSAVEGSRPIRERPVPFSNLPNFVVEAVENKVQRVSSFVQNIPELLTTISSPLLGASGTVSNIDGQSAQYPSVGSAAYPTGSNSGNRRPNNRPAVQQSRPVGSTNFQSYNPNQGSIQGSSSVSSAGNGAPDNNRGNSNPSTPLNNRENNPFQIVVVEPSQNQGNNPSVSQIPSNTQGEPAIPVASGGVVPPSGYVPNDEPFVLTDFHITDPTSSANQGASNTGNGIQSQRPQSVGFNRSPSQNGNNSPTRLYPSNGNSFNQQAKPSSSYPSESGKGVIGYNGVQNPSNSPPSQVGQSSTSFNDVQNTYNQQESSIYTVVNGIQEFTLDLLSAFRALRTKGNVVFSPISITSLLSLLTLGTKGPSSQEIEMALHLPNSLSSSTHHAQYENILRRLNLESRGLNITTSSRLFMEETIPISSSFTTQAALHYNCSVSLENFRQRPTQAKNDVNQWVEKATEGKITDFITAPFSPETLFVAANTIYFNGQWETPFPEYFTGLRDFDTGNGIITIPMMTSVFETSHFYSPQYNLDVTSLPYVGGEFSMIILLPRESPQQKSIKWLERQLDTFLIDEFIANMTSKPVSLSLPKMRLRMKSNLINSLSQLNIRSIFSSSAADFSGLSSKKPLWVSQFLHEAIMEVTETGTVAAAVSAVTLDRMGGYQRINVNKPAILFIYDNVTRLPLFWVRLTKPESIS